MDFEAMWRTLAPLGRAADSGGYFRQPFTAAERECHAWFVEECAARDLRVETDGNGNTIGWWEPAAGRAEGRTGTVPDEVQVGRADPGAERQGLSGGAVLTGSHLDSVLDGGAYDGPLGVLSALAAIDLMRERGVVPTRRIGVGAFVEEEGSRFGLACLGTRLATGTATPAAARELRDRDGVPLLDAMAAAGLEPAPGPAPWVDQIGTFIELHVEQGRALVDRDAAVGVASAIWPHGRYRFDFTGAADHAGSTRMQDRHDPMLTYAMTVLAADKQARLAAQRATFGRVDVAPNATNAIPSRVTAWLDARGESEEALSALVAEITRQGTQRAGRDGTSLLVTTESVSGAVAFDPALADRVSRLLDGAPVIATQAGHDAGILAASGVPTAMLFVRNPTGVSHAPSEHAPLADCLAGVVALADVLGDLAR